MSAIVAAGLSVFTVFRCVNACNWGATKLCVPIVQRREGRMEYTVAMSAAILCATPTGCSNVSKGLMMIVLPVLVALPRLSRAMLDCTRK